MDTISKGFETLSNLGTVLAFASSIWDIVNIANAGPSDTDLILSAIEKVGRQNVGLENSITWLSDRISAEHNQTTANILVDQGLREGESLIGWMSTIEN